MSWASSLGVVPAAGMVVTVVPARSTVTVSATRSTSSSLWLMKTTATPVARRSASEANSASTSCGTSTAVGSSSTITRAPR